jgi:hypothetical protein
MADAQSDREVGLDLVDGRGDLDRPGRFRMGRSTAEVADYTIPNTTEPRFGGRHRRGKSEVRPLCSFSRRIKCSVLTGPWC